MAKFDYKPGWTYVRERKIPPSRCQPGSYRTKRLSAKGAKDVLGVFCCPRGTRLIAGRRGCFRGGKRVARPKLQALRHGRAKFCRRKPRVCKRIGARR